MAQKPNARALQEAREWLARAERDLQAAQNELKASPPLPEISAYHAQQAAEKALKAFLTAHSIPFRFTHDLVELQAQCQTVDPRFARFLQAAQILNPYATQFRYPGGPLAPPQSEAAQALKLADEIFRFVQQELSRFV